VIEPTVLFDFHFDVSSDDAYRKTLHIPLRRRCEDRAGLYLESGTVPRAYDLILCQHALRQRSTSMGARILDRPTLPTQIENGDPLSSRLHKLARL
jgi:hypothetical protein